MNKNQKNIRGIGAHDCSRLLLRLTPEQIRAIRIAAAMANQTAPRFIETRLDHFINENHGKQTELQKAS